MLLEVDFVIEKVKQFSNEYDCIIRLVNSAINNTKADISMLNVDWKIVFKLSVELSFSALVKCGIDNLPKEQQSPREIISAFSRDFAKQIIIDTNQLYELEQLENAFEKNNVDMLLLKGSCIKSIYPQTVYRYMGDIDTYVNKEDFSKADKILEQLGYKVKTLGGHDKIFTKEPFICLEQHFLLYDGKDKKLSRYYENILKKCTLKDGFNHIYEMTPEDIYIYLVVHAVHHFEYAGIAPRIFLDFYVYREKYGNTINIDYINKVLKNFGYAKFEEKAVELAYRWFSPSGSGFDVGNPLDIFIVSGETYGTMEHNVGLRSAKMTADGKRPSKLKFILSQLFPKYVIIQREFRVLEKAPFLLPFVWVAYVFKKAKRYTKSNYYDTINSDAVNFYKNISDELGLK